MTKITICLLLTVEKITGFYSFLKLPFIPRRCTQRGTIGCTQSQLSETLMSKGMFRTHWVDKSNSSLKRHIV
ncbi:unnamed protein product [Arabidopsis thaliana]|uniref:Uncharacterized protein n=1 Tax=Arabidopsis thaliana TaxID=3702 RepID=A0A5S9XJ75_ARATH|nr:unnamed protein product [Arabidopsis thaliana]VYS59738.1 unnamed protein product [Arabidopsis thaliana]